MGREAPAQRQWGGSWGQRGLCCQPLAGGEKQSPKSGGGAAKPGGHGGSCLERLGWRTLVGGIEEAKRKSSP